MLSSSCGLEKKRVRRKIEVYKKITCSVFIKKQEQRPFNKIRKERNKVDVRLFFFHKICL